MKTTKAKAQKRTAKKAARKSLEQSLLERLSETVKNLGHDADKIGDEIAKASRNIAKTIFKNIGKVKGALYDDAEKLEPAKSKSVVQKPAVKKETGKAVKKAEKTAKRVVRKAASKAKPLIRSVEVAGITKAPDKPIVKSAGIISSSRKRNVTAPVKTDGKPVPDETGLSRSDKSTAGRAQTRKKVIVKK